MTKIEFSMDSFRRTVIPKIDNTIDSLNVLISQCYRLTIPNDFKYKDYLLQLDNDLKKCKTNIIVVKEWIEKSNYKYNNIIEEMKKSSVNLNNIQIGRKYSSIR